MKTFGSILLTLINIYYWILFIRLLIPLLKLPQHIIIFYLYKITDPVLNFFRKHFPLRINNIDFSPLIPLLLLFVIQIPIRDFMISQVVFSGWYLLGLLIVILDIIMYSLAFSLFIAGVVLLIININNIYADHPIFYLFRNLFDLIIKPVRKLIKIKNSSYSYRIYLIISIIIVVVSGIIIHLILMSLYGLTIKTQADNFLYKQMMEQ